MITVEQFKEMYMDEDNEVNLPGTACVDTDEVVDGKTVTYTSVYKVGEQYFEVWYYRDNVGYWGDSDCSDVTVAEVFPKTITKVIYVAK